MSRDFLLSWNAKANFKYAEPSLVSFHSLSEDHHHCYIIIPFIEYSLCAGHCAMYFVRTIYLMPIELMWIRLYFNPLFILLKNWGVIHSPTDSHLGCFHILAIIHNAAMNVEVHMFFYLVFLVSSGVLPEVESLGQKEHPLLIFWGISILLFMVVAPTTFPPTVQKCSPFYTSLAALVVCRFIDDRHSDRYKVISHCGFNFHFSDD